MKLKVSLVFPKIKVSSFMLERVRLVNREKTE